MKTLKNKSNVCIWLSFVLQIQIARGFPPQKSGNNLEQIQKNGFYQYIKIADDDDTSMNYRSEHKMIGIDAIYLRQQMANIEIAYARSLGLYDYIYNSNYNSDMKIRIYYEYFTLSRSELAIHTFIQPQTIPQSDSKNETTLSSPVIIDIDRVHLSSIQLALLPEMFYNNYQFALNISLSTLKKPRIQDISMPTLEPLPLSIITNDNIENDNNNNSIEESHAYFDSISDIDFLFIVFSGTVVLSTLGGVWLACCCCNLKKNN